MSATTVPAPPDPDPDPDSAPFWAGLREGRLLLQRCATCARLRFPAMGRCPWCAAAGGEHEDVAPRGRVYSWIVVHRAFGAAFATDVPYVVATVDLDAGPRMALRLDLPETAGTLDFGARVHGRFHDHGAWTELRMVLDA